MMIRYLTSFLLCTFLLISSLGHGSQPNRISENQIGGFDFNGQLITNQKLISLYGEGCVDKDYPYHYRRMYYFPEEDIYIAFKIETDDFVVGLQLTKEPITSKNCNAKKKLNNFGTGKKIYLGDKKEKVIKTYGKPFREEIKGKQITLFEYYGLGEADRPYMEIKLLSDHVVSVGITVGD